MVLPPTSGVADVTPGAIVNTSCRSRPRGTVSSTSFVKATLALVLLTSTTGLCPLTVNVSSSPPTFRRASIRATNPTVSRRSSRTTDVNPLSSNFSR